MKKHHSWWEHPRRRPWNHCFSSRCKDFLSRFLSCVFLNFFLFRRLFHYFGLRFLSFHILFGGGDSGSGSVRIIFCLRLWSDSFRPRVCFGRRSRNKFYGFIIFLWSRLFRTSSRCIFFVKSFSRRRFFVFISTLSTSASPLSWLLFIFNFLTLLISHFLESIIFDFMLNFISNSLYSHLNFRNYFGFNCGVYSIRIDYLGVGNRLGRGTHWLRHGW